MTQVALALAINPNATSGSRVGNYEADAKKNQPSLAVLKIIAAVTGVNLSWLVDRHRAECVAAAYKLAQMTPAIAPATALAEGPNCVT